LSQAVISRMEIDCRHCKSRIRLNLHRAETIVTLANFGIIAALFALAYWYESRNLVLLALGAAMLGMVALPVLERTWLRGWPRYLRIHPDPEA
jgi:hypothetical protein